MAPPYNMAIPYIMAIPHHMVGPYNITRPSNQKKVSSIKFVKLSFVKQITVPKNAQLRAFFFTGYLVPGIKTFGKFIKVSKSLNTREDREPISTNMINKKWQDNPLIYEKT